MVISLIGVFLNRWAFPHQTSKGMGGLVITLALALVLCISLSLELFASLFGSKGGALRHGGRAMFYFPWLRGLALIVLSVIAVLPIIVLGRVVGWS